nr:MAG TPA: hypothetical protein [Caudoviricetes sp.]
MVFEDSEVRKDYLIRDAFSIRISYKRISFQIFSSKESPFTFCFHFARGLSVPIR